MATSSSSRLRPSRLRLWALADRVALLHRGRIVQSGLPCQIHAQPINAFVARFVAQTNLLEGLVVGPRAVPVGRLVLDGHLPRPAGEAAETVLVPGQRIHVGIRPELVEVHEPNPHPTRFDLIVVGAGMVGLAPAYAAAGSGLSVCVVDCDPMGMGNSIRGSGAATARSLALARMVVRNRDGSVLIGTSSRAARGLHRFRVTSSTTFCSVNCRSC